jgi:hypothetical protein
MNFFSYEFPLKDDPGAEDALFDRKTKHYEQAKNHRKTQFSVMFC